MSDHALIIARLLQEEQPSQGDLALLAQAPDPWPKLAQVGLQALLDGAKPWPAVEVAIGQYNGDQEIIREVLYAAGWRAFSEPNPETENGNGIPPLPSWARPDPEQCAGVGKWVDLYANYAEAISPMTPRSFHESAALWLGAVAIARRLRVGMFFGDVYPNLFIFWNAETTLYRKTTALDVARQLARRVFPFLMAAQDTTPEAFLSDLAGREPPHIDALREEDKDDWVQGRHYAAQKGWLLDEMSGLIASAGRDYNAGLVEGLLRFYDNDPFFVRSTRGQGRIVVRDSYLCLLGASTPAAMSQHLVAERLWSMGWWPRFAILTPEGRPPWKTAHRPDEPAELAQGLQRLFNRLPAATWPEPPTVQSVTLGDGVIDLWERYSKAVSYDLLTDDLDHRLRGTYGRLPTQALKVGLILAALDGWAEDRKGPTIELAHLTRALLICEEWRASAHRALAGATSSDFDRQLERILYQCSRHEPQGPTMRDLYKAMRDREPWQIEATLEQAISIGLVEKVEWQNPKGGPKTERYQLVKG